MNPSTEQVKLPPVIKRDNECMVCYDCLVKWGRYEYTEGIATFPLCRTCKEKREKGTSHEFKN